MKAPKIFENVYAQRRCPRAETMDQSNLNQGADSAEVGEVGVGVQYLSQGAEVGQVGVGVL